MNEPFHGLLLVDKEPGGTSHDIVAQARKILGTRSVGHSGTLDPMAGGLMVLLVGEGTKLSNYILDGDKGYRAQARLGIETDTLDITGQVLKESAITCDRDTILATAEELQGEFEWQVPLFSAAKVDGKRLHRYARAGEDVALPTKIMKFWDIKMLSADPAELTIEMRCSKGSYVRSWISELGRRLGCGATMSALVRTESVPYELAQAAKLADIDRAWRAGGPLPSAFVPMEQALPRVKRIRIRGADQTLLLNGQISHDLRSQLISQVRPGLDDLIQVHSSSNQLLALVGLEPGRGFAIRRVFRYPESTNVSS